MARRPPSPSPNERPTIISPTALPHSSRACRYYSQAIVYRLSRHCLKYSICITTHCGAVQTPLGAAVPNALSTLVDRAVQIPAGGLVGLLHGKREGVQWGLPRGPNEGRRRGPAEGGCKTGSPCSTWNIRQAARMRRANTAGCAAGGEIGRALDANTVRHMCRRYDSPLASECQRCGELPVRGWI